VILKKSLLVQSILAYVKHSWLNVYIWLSFANDLLLLLLTKEEKNKIKRQKERKDLKIERKTKRRYFKIRRMTI
jgi:hypothetical protein